MYWLAWLMWFSIAAIVILLGYIGHRRLTERKKSRLLKIINHIRRKRGLSPLKAYYALDKIAKSHSYYMAKHHTCNHFGFGERAQKVERITNNGYVGENCYKYPSRKYDAKIAYKLVDGWMKSPGHRKNLLDANYQMIGFGIVIRKGYIYATQIFSG